MKALITVFTIILCTGAAFAGEDTLNTGDTAWIIVSSALVLLMLPGLALFYGGMANNRNSLSTILYSMIALCVIGLQWAVVGFTIAFGESTSPFFGSMQYVLLGGDFIKAMSGTIPLSVFAMFQGMFAIITCALISGAVIGRIKWSAYLIFITVWATVVYAPLAHWVWAESGWLFKDGALDFAGGTVVHISSGTAALALAIVLGNRRDFMRTPAVPHNLPFTLLGAGILWFGWFGFNAGSALGANMTAALAFANTMIAAAAGGFGWMLIEWKAHKPSALGIASGIVAGLVGITPAAGFVEPWAAIIIGFFAGIICYFGVKLKFKLKIDDSLDVFGIHGLGGIWGALATGIFATVGAEGLIKGNMHQFIVQIKGVVAAAVFSFVVSYIIAMLIKVTIGIRVHEEDEIQGLDLPIHGEKSYENN